MAFQDVSVGEAKKLTGLKEGESITGYVIRFEESMQSKTAREEDPTREPEFNVIMQDQETGGTFLVYSAGNIKYIIKDRKMKVGLLTKITRIADKLVGKKMKKMSSQYKVEQDPSQTIDGGDDTLDAVAHAPVVAAAATGQTAVARANKLAGRG
jgi:hypothetical protein